MKIEKPKAVSTRPRNQCQPPTGEEPQVIKTMVQQLTRPAQSQPIEIYPPSICGDKAIAAQVISWDRSRTLDYYQPEDIERIEYKEDIVRYVLKAGGCIPLSIHQYCWYWEQIQMETAEEVEVIEEISQQEIVTMAKEIGSQIWEHGCKLGFILQYGNWFYAVTEVLTHKGFQYSHSRHGSFYLAQEELRERSWEVA